MLECVYYFLLLCHHSVYLLNLRFYMYMYHVTERINVWIVKIIIISGRANKTNDSVCKGNNFPPNSLNVTVTSHKVVRKIVEVECQQSKNTMYALKT